MDHGNERQSFVSHLELAGRTSTSPASDKKPEIKRLSPQHLKSLRLGLTALCRIRTKKYKPQPSALVDCHD
jgi:hypothetical protein